MPDVAELLGQAEWLTRLARSLTGNAAEADDVVQETYVAALRSPPDPRRPARPWLRRVLVNVVRMRHRGRVRRDAREAATELVVEPTRTPEQLLEWARVERTLTDLVLALEEPLSHDGLAALPRGARKRCSRSADSARASWSGR
jgi:DNA-directed RNA polymerase specialized sigma24 family protein